MRRVTLLIQVRVSLVMGQYQDQSFYLRNWLIDPTTHTLTDGNKKEQVQPQIMKMLVYLAENQGRVIPKDELADAIWTDVTVTNNVLTRTVSRLRTALDDDPGNPTYIETISKSGYRLVVPPTSEPGLEVKKQTITGTKRSFLNKRLLVTAVVVAVVVSIGVLSIGSRLQLSPTPTYQPIPASVLEGGEWDPAISPDGNYVAFSWRGKDNDNWDIYVRLLGTETTVRLTDNPEMDRFPFWSSDGKYIGFARYDEGLATIYKTPSIKNDEVKLINTPVRSWGTIEFSPDNNHIVTNNSKSGPRSIELFSLDEASSKKITMVPKQYLGDYDPRFSNNGEFVVFKRSKNSVSQDLYLLNLKSNTTRQLTTLGTRIFGHSWLPNDEGLLFSAWWGGRFLMLHLRIQDGKITSFPLNDIQTITPHISSDGKVVYMKIKDEHNIWSYRIDDTNSSPWLSSSGMETNAQVSPDSEKVVFTSNRSGYFEIWTADRSAGNLQQLTNFGGAHIANPRWSSDSKWIAFEVFNNSQSDIYRIDANGGIPENLTNNEAQDEMAFFSNSNEIFFSSNRSQSWEVWKMKPDGSDPQQVTNEGGFAPVLDSESKYLYFCKAETKGIWRKDLATNEDSVFAPGFDHRYAGNFIVSDAGVYAALGSPGSIIYYDPSKNNVDLIHQTDKYLPQRTNGITISPDQKEILYTQIDKNDSDLMYFVLGENLEF